MKNEMLAGWPAAWPAIEMDIEKHWCINYLERELPSLVKLSYPIMISLSLCAVLMSKLFVSL